jgi:hypothetical protein
MRCSPTAAPPPDRFALFARPDPCPARGGGGIYDPASLTRHGGSAQGRAGGHDASRGGEPTTAASSRGGRSAGNRRARRQRVLRSEGPPIQGKRIIYSLSQQRVVLVDHGEVVIGDFRVSGNLGLPGPGRYHVIEEGKRVNGWSNGLRLPWFTRFTYGPTSGHRLPRHPRTPRREPRPERSATRPTSQRGLCAHARVVGARHLRLGARRAARRSAGLIGRGPTSSSASSASSRPSPTSSPPSWPSSSAWPASVAA